ncbi:hypothetical protein LTR95_018116 [Oleoguttula sp. CCFEE 5521]
MHEFSSEIREGRNHRKLWPATVVVPPLSGNQATTGTRGEQSAGLSQEDNEDSGHSDDEDAENAEDDGESADEDDSKPEQSTSSAPAQPSPAQRALDTLIASGRTRAQALQILRDFRDRQTSSTRKGKERQR